MSQRARWPYPSPILNAAFRPEAPVSRLGYTNFLNHAVLAELNHLMEIVVSWEARISIAFCQRTVLLCPVCGFGCDRGVAFPVSVSARGAAFVKEKNVNNLIWLVGAVVIVVAVLGYVGIA